VRGAYNLEILVEISPVFQDHPDDDIWEEYSFGRVRDSAEAALEEHLLVCERCQITLANTDQFVRLMKVATASFPANPPQRWKVLPFKPGNRRAKVAAALAVACVAAFAVIGPARSLVAGHTVSAPEPVLVKLKSVRAGSEAGMNRAPAKHPLELSIALSDIPLVPRYRLEVVTFWGKAIWSGPADLKDGALSAHVAKRLGKGTYWVRLYGSSELLAEYGLKLD
jgi:hypothetical protein